MTSIRENNSVAFKDTQQHRMPPQSKTLCTLKGRRRNDLVQIWAEKQASHPTLLKWTEELWCIDSKEGFGFLSHPRTNTSCHTVSPPSCSFFSPGSGAGHGAQSTCAFLQHSCLLWGTGWQEWDVHALTITSISSSGQFSFPHTTCLLFSVLLAFFLFKV